MMKSITKRKIKHIIGWIMLPTGIIGIFIRMTTPFVILFIAGGIYLIWKNEQTPKQKEEYQQKYKLDTE